MTVKHKKRVRLVDVAKLANVATSTASEVINNRSNSYASERVKRKVLDAARKLGYQRSIGYDILMGRRVNITALIYSQPATIYNVNYVEIILPLLKQLNERLDCSVFTQVLTDTVDANVKTISHLINSGCNSFIFIGSPIGDKEILQLLKQHSDVDYLGFKTPSFDRNIQPDRHYIYHSYCKKLLEHGKKNFRLIMCREHLDDYRPEFMKLLPEISENEFKEKHEYVIEDIRFNSTDCIDAMFKTGNSAAKQIIADDPKVQALIFSEDAYAMGAAKALCGRDVVLMGYGDTPMVRCATEQVESCGYNIDQIVNLLVDNLQSKKTFRTSIKLYIKWRKL